MEGTPFGRYRLLDLLGRGGMGEVWRAFDTATERVVAVKVLSPNLSDDEGFERRFRREARIAATLDEPHIVPIHRYGEIDGRLYVDMRLVEGRDLDSVIADHPLGADRAVTVIEQIAAALSAAHGSGLVHRDVKPSNILIDDYDFAYLIDFGIARAAGDTCVTASGEVIGTWAYMAPERFTTDHIDPRSDIYALACVLHECLTGCQPYPGDSVEQQVAAHLTSPPPRPSVNWPGVAAAFDEVVAQGMAKDPDDRFQTTIELARAARAAVTDAAQISPPPLVRRWSAERDRTASATIGPTGGPPSARGNDGSLHSTVSSMHNGTADTVPAAVIAPAPSIPPPVVAQRVRWRPWVVVPALLAAVALVGGAVVATIYIRGGSSSPLDATPLDAIPVEATFEGTFTTTYGAQSTFDGSARPGVIPSATWVVRSTCNHGSCIATATTIDRPEDRLTRIFDYVDGRWLAVTVEPSRCNDVDSPRWERVSLEPRPDGSLDGQFSSAHEGGCSSTSAVTYTRVGDPQPGIQLADPATVPARVPSPAAAFDGRYERTETFPSKGEPPQSDWAVTTMCTRDGGRCLSYLSKIIKNIGVRQRTSEDAQLIFGDGKWTERFSQDGTCQATGQPTHEDYTAEYPLPPGADDPLVELTGRVSDVYTGGCAGTDTYDVVYRRIGE